MSLQSRLAALITAVGADIKSLTTRVATIEGGASVSQEAWHVVGAAGEPAFQNSWASYPSRPIRFRKDPAGKVEIEGAGQSGAAGTVIFNLPAGYRPSAATDQHVFAVAAGGAFSQINISSSTGAVSQSSGSTPLNFGGLQFDTGQTTFPAGKSVIPVVTALPSGPTDGDEIYFQNAAMKTAGIMWRLRYDATSSSAYKWNYLGGGAIRAEDGAPTAASVLNTWTDLDADLAMALPLTGDYEVEYGSYLAHSTNAAGVHLCPIATSLAQATANAISLLQSSGSANIGASVSKKIRPAGISGTLKLQYYTTTVAGTTISKTYLEATPIRVG